MRIACVVEGKTEYYCVPSLLGRMGHVIIGNLTINGCCEDWNQTISLKVVPRVIGMARKSPDKVLVFLDRENREDCCPDLADSAITIISKALVNANVKCNFALVIADRKFESMIFADYEYVDRLTILSHPVTGEFGENTDGKNVLAALNPVLVSGASYDKVAHGLGLIRQLRFDEAAVLRRSRALRKLCKEAPPIV